MAKCQLPSPEVLRQLLRYEPQTGKLFWKERGPEWFASGRRSAADEARAWNTGNAGKEALCSENPRGYLRGGVFGSVYFAHRVAWSIHYGQWPEAHVDHVNGDKADNRIANLREASNAENMKNRGAPVNNTSGRKGVTWHRRDKKWQAKIVSDGVGIYLGYFSSRDEAAAAYDKAAQELHRDFAHPSSAGRWN